MVTPWAREAWRDDAVTGVRRRTATLWARPDDAMAGSTPTSTMRMTVALWAQHSDETVVGGGIFAGWGENGGKKIVNGDE